MALKANVAPSGNFDLRNWKITLPIDSSGGFSGTAVEVKSLVGYQQSQYFYTGIDGAMVFVAPVEGATTSGSSFARSELREMNGTAKAAWSLTQGGVLTATLEIDAAPVRTGVGGRIVVGQIHGQDKELVRLYWENGRMYFTNDQAGSNNAETRFYFVNGAGQQPDVSLDERFSYSITAKGNDLDVSIVADDQTYRSITTINAVWQSDTFYFKAGAYLGANETNGSGYGQTSFYALSLDHGGVSSDVATYNGLRKAYTIIGNLSSWKISGPDCDETLTGVEVLQFTDGRLVYDVADRAAVVYRMYDSAFNRAPDAFGFNGWIVALERGTGVNDIAASFAASAEFQATYGALSNQGFVEQLYRNVLGREGEAGGVTGWTNGLNFGSMSRGQVLVGFSESAEHINLLRPAVEAGLWDQNENATAVARLYHATLDRAPDAAGLTGWTKQLEGGRIIQDVADRFVFSSEFQTKYGSLSNQQFVEQLYLNVLDRNGDAPGLASWINMLNSGQLDRGDVVVGFSESTEFKLKTQPSFNDGILFA